MKKLLSIALALVLILSMSTVAFAASVTNGNPTFTKTYKLANADTSNPEETFTFTYTADHVENASVSVTNANMPTIPASTVTFDAGSATTAGYSQNVTVALSGIEWPGIGEYYYKVKETAGNTPGVKYDNTEQWLKVTVANDDNGEYYVAFVTLSLADTDDNGQTDNKANGFTNTYSAGELEITKTVTGNMGDKDMYFKFTVTLTGETGKTYPASSFAVTGGSNKDNPSTIELGKATTFYLKHNETITIANLPYGVTYSVTEDSYTADGYTTTKSGDTGTINAATQTAAFTNSKSATVDTGVVLDSLPYVLILAVVAGGLVLMLGKKRAARD